MTRRYGEGSIRQRGKSWQICYQRQFRTVHGTKTDAKRALASLRSEIDEGTVANAGRLTVDEQLDAWLARAAQRVRPNTLARYSTLARGHVRPVIGGMKLRDLRPVDVQRVVDESLRKGLSATTTRHAFRVVASCLADAVRLQLIAVNPAKAVRPPRVSRPQLDVPTPEQIATILDRAKGTIWHRPLVLLALSGARRGEILGLRWSAVDLDAGTMRVERTLQGRTLLPPKTPRSRRGVSLSDAAVSMLRTQRREQTERRLLAGESWNDGDFCFDSGGGEPLNGSSMSHAFLDFARAAGRPCRLHDLRHAHVSALLMAGVPVRVVSDRVGHSSISFLLDTYAHLLPTDQASAASVVEEAYAGLGAISPE